MYKTLLSIPVGSSIISELMRLKNSSMFQPALYSILHNSMMHWMQKLFLYELHHNIIHININKETIQ